jgi:hypothetical protein
MGNSMHAVVRVDKVFGYGDEDLPDHGWGCVYRCVQTIRSVFDLAHVSVPDMYKACHGHELNTDDGRAGVMRWIEPPDIKKHSLMAVNLKLFGTSLGSSGRCLLYTPFPSTPKTFLNRFPQRSKLSDFDEHRTSPEDFLRFMVDTLRDGRPLVVDDKISSFVVWGITRDMVRFGDPHLTNVDERKKKTMPVREFLRKAWMVYEPCGAFCA